jgi:hypothetical protein
MNNTDHELESLLRQAPKLRPAPGLREKLLSEAKAGRQTSHRAMAERSPASWFRRWWPALAPGAVSLACAVVLTAQRMEINEIRQSLRALSPAPAAVQTDRTPGTALPSDQTVTTDSASQEDELTRLRQLAAQLKSEVARLEQMRTENEKLRAQIATASSSGLSPEELDAMNKARERANSIQCVNNLKQVGLAVRVWALDNADIYPTNFLCMSNELNTPKILLCPADTNRVAAANWAVYTDANCSYELFPASDTEPTQILSRCPIHGNIGLADGSVQMGAAKTHRDWLVERNGKLYFEQPANPPARNAPATNP